MQSAKGILMRTVYETDLYSLYYDVTIDCYSIVDNSEATDILFQTTEDIATIETTFKIEGGFCNIEDDTEFNTLCAQYADCMS